MARMTFEDWIPEEYDSSVIQIVQQTSIIEAVARRYPMSTDTRHVPRSGSVDVATIAKGGAYGEDVNANDEILLTARKFGRAIRIADEDLQDSNVDILTQKRNDWATGYAKFLDNACLGTTAASNGTTVPFASLYYQLTQADADTGYGANDNLVQTASGAPLYDELSDVLGRAETGPCWDEGMAIVMAHPSFKKYLRGIKDDNGQPIFVQGQGGDSGTPSTLFGYEMRFSLGCRAHATASASPTGHPLLYVGNRDYLALGIRSGPESRVAGPDTGAAFLTDEALLKMRSRRGFNVGNEFAFACLEVVV